MNVLENLTNLDGTAPLFDIGDASIASVLKHEGVLTLGANEASFLSMKKNDSHFVVEINQSLHTPLVIDCDFSEPLFIVTKNDVHAHVLIRERSLGQRKISVATGAHLYLYCVAETNTKILQNKSSIDIEVFQSGQLQLFSLDIGEQNYERIINVELLGQDASVSYFGLDQLHSAAKNNSCLTIFHRAEKTKSAQVFRGIYAGEARGIFFGKVVIDAQAKDSSACQLYKSIILNKGATAHVMPQLEINNHNIVASHGASVGELDENAVFYMCSRGITPNDAKNFLITSLLHDIVDHIEVLNIKSFVNARLSQSIKRSLEEHHD